MKRKLFLFGSLLMVFAVAFVSCEEILDDTCSNEIGDIGPDYNCDVPVMPEICTVDGVDDHWILDGEEYSCNGDCTNIPAALVEAIKAKEGCSTKKIANIDIVNAKISKRAEVILANLRMEATLCNN